jgi:hypothetical protein
MSADAKNRVAFQRLDDWIRNLREFDRAVPEMAQALVPVVESATAEAIKAQTSLDGVPWEPTKDGAPALVNAMRAITVRAINTVILIQMHGPEVFHQFGFRKTPARPILPTAGMPKRLGNAIRKGIVDMGVDWMTRSGGHRGRSGVRMKPGMKA